MFAVVCFQNYGHDFHSIYGVYETKERALEVKQKMNQYEHTNLSEERDPHLGPCFAYDVIEARYEHPPIETS